MELQHLSKAEYKVQEEITSFFKKILGKDFDASLIQFSHPPKSEMGHTAVACFSLAKILSQKPHELAKNYSQDFNSRKSTKGGVLKKAQNFGPYINFFVDQKKYYACVLEQILKEKDSYGHSKVGNGQKIMIEYSQPNTHKEFHVGHLRNVCVGVTLVNLYRALGYKVLAVNYIGDVGSHVAKCLWAFQKFHKNESLPENKGKYLGRLYTEAIKKIEEDESLKKEADEVLQKLEYGDKKLTMLWKKTRRWSLEEFYSIYRKLHVTFDHYFFESEVEKAGKKIVDTLLKKKIAQKSQGATIIDLEKYNLKQFLLLKTDGTSLYSTKDLALAELKFKKYKIDKSFYVVDNRQSFYFQQLFQTLQVMGFAKDMHHIAYDFVTTQDGAMASRKGNVILYEDFEERLIEEATKETKARHSNWKNHEILDSANGIAYAAMKHDMIAQGNDTIITFDIERALRFSGKTGPYLLYVYARIQSVLKKTKSIVLSNLNWSELDTKEEEDLVSVLSQYPEKLLEAANHFEPSILVSYLHELAKAFSNFYQNVPILKTDKKKKHSRLALVSCVKIVIENGLEIINIEPVEKM